MENLNLSKAINHDGFKKSAQEYAKKQSSLSKFGLFKVKLTKLSMHLSSIKRCSACKMGVKEDLYYGDPTGCFHCQSIYVPETNTNISHYIFKFFYRISLVRIKATDHFTMFSGESIPTKKKIYFAGILVKTKTLVTITTY